ncbi:MAG: DNA-binding transcriptional regulator [Verrucomicrobiaceae bacterium]|nr:MAG: DNA-binding transcriptional regulator [Verrucomicrobiaceae bacterium]
MSTHPQAGLLIESPFASDRDKSKDIMSFRVKASSPSISTRPQVALLIETSLASGRGILSGVARHIRENHQWSVFHQPRCLHEGFPSCLRGWRGDGIIARIQDPSMLQAIKDLNVPVVDVLGLYPEPGITCVRVDDEAIARMAAQHLSERGFRHFAFVGISGENWSERRREALRAWTAERQLDLTVHEAPRGEGWMEQVEVLAQWIAGLPRPCGIMVCSDQRGPEVLEACSRAGVSIPDEIAVVGVDNDVPICEVSWPALSSVDPAHDQVGYEAARLLAGLMAGGDIRTTELVLPPRAVASRYSSEILAISDRVVGKALRLIRERACDGIGVDDVVDAVPVSRSVLQRRFRSALGTSVHDEILAARLKRAKQLLVETELSYTEIAERAGFRHQEYLGAVFKIHTGKTPGRYRAELRR